MQDIHFNNIYNMVYNMGLTKLTTYFYIKYKIRWQFSNLESFHEIFLIGLIFFFGDGIKFV